MSEMLGLSVCEPPVMPFREDVKSSLEMESG